MTFTTRVFAALFLAFALGIGCFSWAAWAGDDPGGTADDRRAAELFESRIRPVLIEHCYECHNSLGEAEGGLAVDWRDPLRAGGDSGSPIDTESPEGSLLIRVIRHEIDGLEMPSGGPRLAPEVIADFERWIRGGAVDPRDSPPSPEEFAAERDWERLLERRREWWSLLPIRAVRPPNSRDAGDVTGDAITASPAQDDDRSAAMAAVHPVDRFVMAGLEEIGLPPAAPATGDVLVRRLHVQLLGLPPSPESARRWVGLLERASGPERSAVIESLVDELLESPRFGERWARHWMDWIRYAETHGSEGDPEIADAWRFRDYLIRALNDDVPVDQLIREHVAGDLLDRPRIDPTTGLNESAIGPAHWRMVFHGFAPTDALDEKVRFVDDQINTFTKAFLGLTVSCARCHDHKFDAISQADYYALFGVLASCRPARTVIDVPTADERSRRSEMATLKARLRGIVSRHWLESLDVVRDRFLATLGEPSRAGDGESDAPRFAESFMGPLTELGGRGASDGTDARPLPARWGQMVSDFRGRGDGGAASGESWPGRESWPVRVPDGEPLAWDDLRDPATWFRHGTGLSGAPQDAGDFAVAAFGQRILQGIYPAGAYSHLLSTKDPARLTSADFRVADDSEVWAQVIGGGDAKLRYVVHDYPRPGTVYPVRSLRDDWRWERLDLGYWGGDEAHLELATEGDSPLPSGGASDRPARSWFGIRRVRWGRSGSGPPGDDAEHLAPLFDAADSRSAGSVEEIAEAFVHATRLAIEAWGAGNADDAQALLLDRLMREEALPNRMDAIPDAEPLVNAYRQLESELPEATRVPGLEERPGRDHPLFARGDHRQPRDPVPRRFLEVLDGRPYATEGSGRRELAEDLLRADNPLTRRVLVNRVWHHLFGQGIVRTPDNFGRLGDSPSHPELLDWLANRFAADGWSLKGLIRLLVTSAAWQRSSTPGPQASEKDPENRWLSHANVRRLEAEAIRDALLSVSGQLEHRSGGPPVAANVPRRGVYVRVRRNALDPFLRTFDFPEPFAAVGRRDVTNVPAQSLTLLNDPAVERDATAWARRVLTEDESRTDAERIGQMFWAAFGRPAVAEEIRRAEDFLAITRQEFARDRQRFEQLQDQIGQNESKIGSLWASVRERLDRARTDRERTDRAPGRHPDPPRPTYVWDFALTAGDEPSAGDERTPGDGSPEMPPLKFHGDARVTDEALRLADGGYAVTAPLPISVREKTLEAWVELDQLGQRGGGVMTFQTLSGDRFDAIVFGEQEPRKWLAGSEHFHRTQSFGGPDEAEAAGRPVHLAIAYHADGRVAAYRDGVPYGQAYRSGGPAEFSAGQCLIGLGIRHTPAGGNRMLAGRILRARFYDRALDEDEIRASRDAAPKAFTAAEIEAAMTPEELVAWQAMRGQIQDLRLRSERLGPIPTDVDETLVWVELARSMFTFQEFIYLR